MENANYDMMDDEYEEVDTLPYLVFKIDDVMYALNGETINSIFVLEQIVTQVPRTETHVRGIINVRGEVVPLIDLRILFGLPSLEIQQQDFGGMIDAHIKEVVDWVKALKTTMSAKTSFDLPVGLEECCFYKWTKTFVSPSSEVSSILRQISEPHEILHQLGGQILEELEQTKFEINSTIQAYERELDECYDIIINLLGSMNDAYERANKQMAVILQKDKTQIGILVDEVMEVTYIDNISPLDSSKITYQTRFVYGVGTVPQYSKHIMMVNVDQILYNVNVPVPAGGQAPN